MRVAATIAGLLSGVIVVFSGLLLVGLRWQVGPVLRLFGVTRCLHLEKS